MFHIFEWNLILTFHHSWELWWYAKITRHIIKVLIIWGTLCITLWRGCQTIWGQPIVLRLASDEARRDVSAENVTAGDFAAVFLSFQHKYQCYMELWYRLTSPHYGRLRLDILLTSISLSQLPTYSSANSWEQEENWIHWLLLPAGLYCANSCEFEN